MPDSRARLCLSRTSEAFGARASASLRPSRQTPNPAKSLFPSNSTFTTRIPIKHAPLCSHQQRRPVTHPPTPYHVPVSACLRYLSACLPALSFPHLTQHASTRHDTTRHSLVPTPSSAQLSSAKRSSLRPPAKRDSDSDSTKRAPRVPHRSRNEYLTINSHCASTIYSSPPQS